MTGMAVSAILVGTLLQGVATPTAVADDMPGVPASEKPLSGHGVKVLPRTTGDEPRVPAKAPRHAWPKTGTATVTLRPGTKPVTQRAGDLPVSLTTPAAARTARPEASGAKAPVAPLSGAATVRVLDRKAAERAGVDGLLFAVTPESGAAPGTVGVSVDYSTFAQGYGGAYAARLGLVRLPACALT
ncbi:hypothetical protein ACWCOY_36840, partial [Streptomyces tubercidicus]